MGRRGSGTKASCRPVRSQGTEVVEGEAEVRLGLAKAKPFRELPCPEKGAEDTLV